MEISKELLSEVSKIEVDDYEIVDNYIFINQTDMLPDGYVTTTNGRYESKYNMDTLAKLCKEWAKDREFFIISNLNADCAISKVQDFDWELDGDKLVFEANTEPEAIFKACEYILKSRGKQCQKMN